MCKTTLKKISLGLYLSATIPLAYSATIQVNTTADLSLSSNTLYQRCVLKQTQFGLCSLRDGVRAANNYAGADTILLPAGTFKLTRLGIGENNNFTGDLDIKDSLSILGAGNTNTFIDGNKTDRVLHLENGNLVLQNLTIQNGSLVDYHPSNKLRRGAGILNAREFSFPNSNWNMLAPVTNRLTLNNVVIKDITSGAEGIYNLINNANASSAKLTLINSTISDVKAGSSTATLTHLGGGGVTLLNSVLKNNQGAGIIKTNHLIIENSVIENNSERGGLHIACLSDNNTVTINNSVIAKNKVDQLYYGNGRGGISFECVKNNFDVKIDKTIVSENDPMGIGYDNNNPNMIASKLTITQSTIDGNQGGEAYYDGLATMGGIIVESVIAPLQLSIQGSTISNNKVPISNATGSGVMLHGNITAEIINSTISGNYDYDKHPGTGISNGGGKLKLIHSTITNNYGGGVSTSTIGQNQGVTTLQNTIIAKQSYGPDCYTVVGGIITSNGGNLDSDGSCQLDGKADLTGVNPLLGPLQKNGGPTKTHDIAWNSPALDSAILLNNVQVDQRGYQRPKGVSSDIGAYELILATPIPCFPFGCDPQE